MPPELKVPLLAIKTSISHIYRQTFKTYLEQKEIEKWQREARFGKNPDTVIFNANGNYSAEELNSMSIEHLEQLMKKEAEQTIEAKTLEKSS